MFPDTPTQNEFLKPSKFILGILAAATIGLTSCKVPDSVPQKTDQEVYKEQIDTKISSIPATIKDPHAQMIAQEFIEVLSTVSRNFSYPDSLRKLPEFNLREYTDDDWKIINQLSIVEELPKQPRNLNDLKTQGLSPLFVSTMPTSEWYFYLYSQISVENLKSKTRDSISPIEWFSKNNPGVLVIPVNSTERNSTVTTIFFFEDHRKTQNPLKNN